MLGKICTLCNMITQVPSGEKQNCEKKPELII